MDNYNQDPNQQYQQPQYQQPQYQQPQYQQPAPQGPEDPGKGMGIASLVLGIAGLCLSWLYGGGCIMGIVGIVMAVMSGNKSKLVGLNRSGLATAGLVMSILAVVFGAGCLICTIAGGATLCAAGSAGLYY